MAARGTRGAQEHGKQQTTLGNHCAELLLVKAQIVDNHRRSVAYPVADS